MTIGLLNFFPGLLSIRKHRQFSSKAFIGQDKMRRQQLICHRENVLQKPSTHCRQTDMRTFSFTIELISPCLFFKPANKNVGTYK
jgi:hypothetical protein